MNVFQPAPIKPPVNLTALDALDMRVGTIVAVDDIPSSQKLVKLRVDLGDHTRSILAGLKKERADLTELIGKQTLFLVNLEPKRMAGELSEGMLLDIGYADQVLPALAMPERPLPNGVRVG
jgi:tRNA-binding protein